MFRIVATLFLMVNGVTSDAPVGRVSHSLDFDTQARCEEYLASPAFIIDEAYIRAILRTQDEALVPKFACEAKA